MTTARQSCALAALATLACLSLSVCAAPTTAQVAELCANAEDQAHCGRLIEEAQLKRLHGLAARDGDELRITLYPTGVTTFRDSVAIAGAKSYAVWDYFDRINAVVLFTTDGDQSAFLLLQRANGHQYRLPAEPVLAPDRQHLVTADFCSSGCEGEVAVWRVTRDDVRKELAWKPSPAWSDASATWQDFDVVRVEYTVAGEDKPRVVTRRLSDDVWVKR